MADDEESKKIDGGEGMKITEEEATAFFADLYHGEHHFPGKLKPYGDGFSMSNFGCLSTFDGDALTRLVFLAHARCIRVQVDSGGPNRLRIAIWKRVRGGRIYERHPTIEEALAAFRMGEKECHMDSQKE